MINGRHVTHSSSDRPLPAKRLPLNMNVVTHCEPCDRLFVVFLPAGTGLTCGDCGSSRGFNCPQCGELVDFEAKPIATIPTVVLAFTAGDTLGLS